jgi:hypothetical protein
MDIMEVMDVFFLEHKKAGGKRMKQNTHDQVIRVGTLARALKTTIDRAQEPGGDDLAEYGIAECLIEKIIGTLAQIAEEIELSEMEENNG